MPTILIIGESCRDIFVYCEAKRLCPDVPVPVLNVLYQKDNPGMAYNVYRNALKLSDECFIHTNSGWRDITKTRYVDEKSNHHFMRVDSPHLFKEFFPHKNYLETFDVIAISDYNKGFLSEETIQFICENHPCVFIDTKKPVSRFCKDAKYIKINDFEYQNSLPFLDDNLSAKIIHTVGERGCFFEGDQYLVDEVEVKDVSGAGDAFFAALVVEYSKTQDIKKSIKFANQCASEVVKHKGVTTL
jgi:bifunctional ADP-heptose synthase (sugar kinase/adenylyltransferase)